MFELDHIFLFPSTGREAEERLTDFGISIGERGIHKGQGTANSVAFFDNAYLELLWKHDEGELRSDPVRPLCLWERASWHETGASPFGVAVRLTKLGSKELPIGTWPYEAPFLPEGATIPIVTPQYSAREPMVFLSLVSQAPATWLPNRRPPLTHYGQRRKLTGLVIFQPLGEPLSDGIAWLVNQGVFAIEDAPEPCVELVWDDGTAGDVHDFCPDIPLRIRW